MKQGKESDTGLRIASDTGEAIRANVSDNTLKAYEHATRRLEDWLDDRTLNDAVLAEYIRFLHTGGKSLATINLLLSAVKWMAEYHGIEDVAGAITKRTWSDIRGVDSPREQRQTDGLTWNEVERVCTVAESSGTVAGLRDARNDKSDERLSAPNFGGCRSRCGGYWGGGASDTQDRAGRRFVYL